MSEDWTIQASTRRGPNGETLINVRGHDPQEIGTKLKTTLGVVDQALMDQAVTNVQQGFPGAEVVSEQGTSPQQDSGLQPSPAAAQAPTVPQQAPAQAQGQPQGPPCGICGIQKKWVPPGTSSRTGKPYQGFWACPNNRDQQHTQAKAAGMKE